MMMKRLSFLASLTAAVALTVACGDKKAVEEEEDEEEEMVESVNTNVRLRSSLDSASYAAAVIIAKEFKEYDVLSQLNVEEKYLDDFIEGIEEACSGKDDKRKEAHNAGVQIGTQLESIIKNTNKDVFGEDSTKSISRDHYLAAFIQSVRGKELKIAENDAQQIVDEFKKRQKAAQSTDEIQEGENFLRENAQKPGVKTTASGLQYKVITQGTGLKPGATDRVKVHYEGRLLDGTVFDSSYTRGEPAVFGLNQVIAGWTEGLQLMPVGSTYELYIPYNLAYGDRSAGDKIAPYSTLIFKVELLGIEN